MCHHRRVRGGGGSHVSYPVSDSTSVFALNNGIAVDLAFFSRKKVHTLIASIPADKPEGNQLYKGNLSSYQLITSALGNDNNLSESSVLSDNIRRGLLASQTVSGLEQAAKDMFLRHIENEILGRRLKQLPKSQSYLKSVPPEIQVGTEWNNVYVNDVPVNLTCRYISQFAYLFVDNRNVAQMEQYMADYGQAFDAIYIMMRSKFGSENDVDGNGKIIIVFSQELSGGLLGYFYAVDKFPKIYFPNSNQGDIIYITTTSMYQGELVKATLAHEFQHMIYFDEHYNQGVYTMYTWLNEALSQAAEYYSGYTLLQQYRIREFLKGEYSGLSLTYWTDYNYGYCAIFIRYLIDQYQDQVIRKLCTTSKVGIAAVEEATGTDFNVIFANFARALVMSGTGDSTDEKYQFKTLDLKAIQAEGRGGLISTVSNINGNATYSDEICPYGMAFYSLTSNVKTIKLNWKGSIQGVRFALNR